MEAYRTGRHIGEGAHGVVLLAHHIQSGRPVALKKVNIKRPEDGLPSTALREIMALRMIVSLVLAAGPAWVWRTCLRPGASVFVGSCAWCLIASLYFMVAWALSPPPTHTTPLSTQDDHENVVRLFDVVPSGNAIVLVFEFMTSDLAEVSKHDRAKAPV